MPGATAGLHPLDPRREEAPALARRVLIVHVGVQLVRQRCDSRVRVEREAEEVPARATARRGDSFAAPPAARAATVEIDPVQSQAGSRVRRMMVARVRGTFFGTLTFDAKHPPQASVTVSIEASRPADAAK